MLHHLRRQLHCAACSGSYRSITGTGKMVHNNDKSANRVLMNYPEPTTGPRLQHHMILSSTCSFIVQHMPLLSASSCLPSVETALPPTQRYSALSRRHIMNLQAHIATTTSLKKTGLEAHIATLDSLLHNMHQCLFFIFSC